MEEIHSLIKLAKDIKNSDRWDNHNKRIEALCNNPQDVEDWYIYVFAELTANTFEEYLKLEKAYENQDMPEICWRARNLLELSIWSLYCVQSNENAKQFYGDGGRDAMDLLKKLGAWDQKSGHSEQWEPQIEQSGLILKKFAKDMGLGSFEARYKSVNAAAKELGLELHYDTANKLLSKFIHPTALRVIGYFDDDRIKDLKTGYFGQGCTSFAGAFNILEEHLINLLRNDNN